MGTADLCPHDNWIRRIFQVLPYYKWNVVKKEMQPLPSGPKVWGKGWGEDTDPACK
jgi:hypothetical protein